jgi:hypothetical protein
MFRTQSKMNSNNPLIYTQMNSFDNNILDDSSTVSQPFNSNQGALDAIDHDHAFLTKRTPVIDLPTSSNSKRTPKRGSRRTSSRIQSRTVCSSQSESSSTSSTTTKRALNVSRATDIKTPDDLTYYLERRRKNNEASKTSRAARKQKFGDMDQRW